MKIKNYEDLVGETVGRYKDEVDVLNSLFKDPTDVAKRI